MPVRPLLLAAVVALAPTLRAADPAPQLKVSDNKRFLVTGEGRPFFWLADTAWELFHRTTAAEATQYLDTRAKQGFNVVQAVALAELDGVTVPSSNGFLPLTDGDPARPLTKDGPDNDYWDHVDFVVKQANDRGIVVALLPTWGRYWHDKGVTIFTPENAAVYGEWLGNRYKDAAVVWVLGGDRAVETDAQKAVVRAMAAGLHKGDGGKHLRTFHPPGGRGSAEYFHAEDWLDFNLRQNGHAIEFTGRYDKTKLDYDRTPTKPVIDGEPVYEEHPVNFKAKQQGHTVAADVRRAFYWDVFGGACGHTYGHHSVWQMWTPERKPVNAPLKPWADALADPGAEQVALGKKLIESRPFLSRVPDDALIVPDRVPTAVPGAGTRRFAATRDAEGTYAMIYAPVGLPFTVDTGKLKAKEVVATWYDPRTGRTTDAGRFANEGRKTFTPPAPGELTDWVLVLDDAGKSYPPPGAAK